MSQPSTNPGGSQQSSADSAAGGVSPADFPPFLVGHGFDIHRLEAVAPAGEGRPFILGGIQIDHELGPVGHSDGDALLHALTDALLGAIGGPDIGDLFPDTAADWDNAESSIFVREAVARCHAAGYTPTNIDATIILERPKLKDNKQKIRTKLAELAGIPVQRVAVKGKTHERVDAAGEGRAVVIHCTVLLSRRSV